jgi:hypothetical protein
MRSLVWAFVASFALHTLILSVGLRYAFYVPIGGYHKARQVAERDDVMGMDQSTGDAINMSAGAMPLVAPQADQTQAWLSRESADAVNVSHAAVRPVSDPGDAGGGGFGSPSPQAKATPRVVQRPPVMKAQQQSRPPAQQPTKAQQQSPQTPPQRDVPQIHNDQAPPAPAVQADAQPSANPPAAPPAPDTPLTPLQQATQELTQATRGNGQAPG